MAPLLADHTVVDSSLTSEHRQSPILPNHAPSIGSASYVKYLKVCILKNLDRPELVTPSLINAAYLGWLLATGDADSDRVQKVFAEVSLSLPFSGYKGLTASPHRKIVLVLSDFGVTMKEGKRVMQPVTAQHPSILGTGRLLKMGLLARWLINQCPERKSHRARSA